MKTSRSLRLFAALSLTLVVSASPASGSQWQQIDQESSPSTSGSDFGNAVAIENGIALVGDPSLNFNQGAAYVYVRNSNDDWVLDTTLPSPNGGKFGASVDLFVNSSTCRAIVGAREENSPNTFAGAAYIYDCEDWSNPVRITTSKSQISDTFGASVSIFADRALIGAPGHNGGGVSNAGAAYTFIRSGNSWIQEQKLIASNPSGAANFGRSVSLTYNRAAVGAPLFNSSRGAAYVFDFNGSSWQEQAFLEASDNDSGDRNGWSVSVSGNFLLTGAFQDDSVAANSGAAYVFMKDNTQGWIEQKKLKAGDAQSGDQFGFSVFLVGRWAVVGAISEDEGGFSAGAAYIFNRDTCEYWRPKDKILADDASASDIFGSSVQLDAWSEYPPWPQPLTAYLTVITGAPGNGNGAVYWHENEIPAYLSDCKERVVG